LTSNVDIGEHRLQTSKGDVVADTDAEAVARLRSLKRIVVVVMENRSFDHMLGYLKIEGMAELEGLTGREYNVDRNGNKVYVHPFDAENTALQRHGEALQKRLDPDHAIAGVKVQLGTGYDASPGAPRNHGFVKSFIESRKKEDAVSEDLWLVPMGHYTSKDLPVYDHLARQFCVCDHWYSAIPGDTWPNRLYAVAGESGPNIAETSDLWDDVTDLPPLKRLKGAPLFDVPAFTRQLRDNQWRWYSHDPGTLRLVDGRYRDLSDLKRDNFAFFDRRKVDWITETLEKPIVRGGSFLDDAAKNVLPQVCWIDPNFVDVSVRETVSNDDHPPSDIRAGQAFVLDVYDALRRTSGWDDTLLIVTYDEHGGFFDHVTPPELPRDDEARKDGFETYGVRVPALIAGPRVRQGVLGAAAEAGQPQFDHTTPIKTILTAFAEDPDAAVRAMPGRVQRAPHLGRVLLDEPRRDVDEPRNQRSLMETWRQQARRRREVRSDPEGDGAVPSLAPDGAGQDVILTDFAAQFHSVAVALRRLGIDA
jgi:phospholipase C